MKCPRCKSEKTESIAWRSQLIALDDAVDIEEWICHDCDYNWEA